MGKTFRFRHFEVLHEKSTMKVGTDAFVLGSRINIDPDCKYILDIGTGSGVIALMLAQKSNAQIHAIDIDEASVSEALINFENSPWKSQLKAFHCSLQNYFPEESNKYDLIVSNPPFFQNSLLPQSPRLQIAKHNVVLTLQQFIENVIRLLTPDGSWAVIIPFELLDEILKLAAKSGYGLICRLNIIPKSGKPANRVVAEFRRAFSGIPQTENLVIRDEFGKYTPGYKELTQDYHAEGYL